MKHLSFVSCLLIAGLLLAACISTPAPAVPAAQPTAEAAPAAQPTAEAAPAAETAPQDGGTLIVQAQGMVQFDYARTADDNSFWVLSNVYSTLVRCDRDHSVFGDAITSWEFEDDTTVILHVREGLTWHDGNELFPEGKSRPVVADDVVYSIKRGAELEGSTISADFLAGFESVEKVDDYTVKLKMKAPNAMLFSCARGLGGFAVVPQEAIEKWGDDFAQQPIGSGPFEFVEYKPDESVTLRANEDYYIKPHLDKLVYKVIPDQDASVIALENKEIDWLSGVPEPEFARLNDTGNYVMQPTGYECAPWMMFDFSVPMFNDPNVRKAVALAIDGEGISKNVAGTFYKGGCGISGKGVPGYDPNLCQYFPFDPAQAKALLAESGWVDSNGDGVLDKDGLPMKFELEIWNMAPMPRYGEAIAIQLKEAGFPVELQTVEFGTWIDDLFKGPGKAMMASGFCTDGGLNGVFGREAATAKALKYDMPEIYDLLDKANVTIDPAKRDEILREAQEKLFSQYLSVPLRHSSGYAAAQTWVHDFPGAMWTLNVVTDRNNAWVAK